MAAETYADKRHAARWARQAELAHLTKRQLARLFALKRLIYSHARPICPTLRAIMRLTKDDILWGIIDMELPA